GAGGPARPRRLKKLGPVRIVTFNVKHGSVTDGQIDNRLLARTCAGLEADILALQEVDRRATRSGFADQMRLVARATGLAAAFGEAARRGPLRRYGNVLLVRGALSEVEVVGLPRPEDGEFRVAVLARVRLDATGDGGATPPALSVAATHLSFRKSEGPAQLRAVVELLDRRPPPRILLGDLNLAPELVEPTLAGAGYQLAATGPTFPAKTPRTRIDYVAVSGLEVVSADAPELSLSDHRAVVAEVAVGSDQSAATG
ncbi:MAG: endonuclease/exonuclease/phosphatase family protein, partial [Acidimicrobiales bacterium]